MADICRVILRVDIIVLKDASGIKVVDESTILEVLVNILCFLFIDHVRDIGETLFFPYSPLGLLESVRMDA